MIDRKKNTDLSKFLSYVLRHNPDLIGIDLDSAGWTDVNDLIVKINSHGRSINLVILSKVVSTCDKNRFAFNADKTKIRANQGHSIRINHGFKPIIPPNVLYHGTSKKNEASILLSGLDKGKRHHVHLGDTIEAAVIVGTRHGKPIVFEINAQKMNSDGFIFYKSENDVWLSEKVPSKYLRKL